jgi:DNA-directed RNA polymerase specialized sigma24 family protein
LVRWLISIAHNTECSYIEKRKRFGETFNQYFEEMYYDTFNGERLKKTNVAHAHKKLIKRHNLFIAADLKFVAKGNRSNKRN